MDTKTFLLNPDTQAQIHSILMVTLSKAYRMVPQTAKTNQVQSRLNPSYLQNQETSLRTQMMINPFQSDL